MPESIFHHTALLTSYILSEKLNKPQQLDEGIKYLTELVRKHGHEVHVDEEIFKRESGIGVVVTDEEVINFIGSLFEESKALILAEGHAFDFSQLIYKARD